MAERVVPWEVGFCWEPNAPEAVLAASDDGRAVLALNAHFDDADQACVVFVWFSGSPASNAKTAAIRIMTPPATPG